MKIHRVSIVIILVIGLLLANRTVVSAFPPLPASFYGTARINGADAPVGTPVTAWIDGIQYAAGTVSLYQGRSVYSLIVPGDDPATIAVTEGGSPGEPVVFRIGLIHASQTAQWTEGANIQVDLSATDNPAIIPCGYLPLVVK